MRAVTIAGSVQLADVEFAAVFVDYGCCYPQSNVLWGLQAHLTFSSTHSEAKRKTKQGFLNIVEQNTRRVIQYTIFNANSKKKNQTNKKAILKKTEKQNYINKYNYNILKAGSQVTNKSHFFEHNCSHR